MQSRYSDTSITEKWKYYISSIMRKRSYFNDISEKYFKSSITESSERAVEGNWIRILGFDYNIKCINLNKKDSALGIAIDVKNDLYNDCEIIQRHYLRTIWPNHCIGASKAFLVGDEILEVNGIKLFGMHKSDVFKIIRKLSNFFQIVVARKIHNEKVIDTEYRGSAGNFDSTLEFGQEQDEDDVASKCSTLRSMASNYSTTSRDFSMSMDDVIDTQRHNMMEYLSNIDGWRGPLVLEFRKRKESLGIGLEEMQDPRTKQRIIVFKCIMPTMKAGQDGRIHVGDRLLHVNGKTVDNAPFRKVCQWMKTAPQGRLILYICQPHFKPIGFENLQSNHDELFSPTLDRSHQQRQLSQLIEEHDATDGDPVSCESIEVPPFPEHKEHHITIRRGGNGEKLGIYFDIVDGGKHGCRIRSLAEVGLVKRDARLVPGDYVTMICGVNWRIGDKSVLQHSIRQVASDADDYKISFVPAEDIQIHKNAYIEAANLRRKSFQKLYPDSSVTSVSNEFPDQYNPDSLPYGFEVFEFKLVKEQSLALGLQLNPSIDRPTQYICVIEVNPDSAANESGLFRINDVILSVNTIDFNGISVSEASNVLQNLWMSNDELHFRVCRLANDDDKPEFVNAYPMLDTLPDMYVCVITKSPTGYGFSLKSLGRGLGVVIDAIEYDSPAFNSSQLCHGHRLVAVNNVLVLDCSYESVIRLIKSSLSPVLGLVLEKNKFIQFPVTVVKGPDNSFGLNVAGGIDTALQTHHSDDEAVSVQSLAVVESLVPGHQSQFSTEVQPGDLITQLDRVSLLGMTHADVINCLRLHHEPSANFVLCRRLPHRARPELLQALSCGADDPRQQYRVLCTSSPEVRLMRPADSVTSYGMSLARVVVLSSRQVTLSAVLIVAVEPHSVAHMFGSPQLRQQPYLLLSPMDTSSQQEEEEDVSVLLATLDSAERICLRLHTDLPYSPLPQQSLVTTNVTTLLTNGNLTSNESEVEEKDEDDESRNFEEPELLEKLNEVGTVIESSQLLSLDAERAPTHDSEEKYRPEDSELPIEKNFEEPQLPAAEIIDDRELPPMSEEEEYGSEDPELQAEESVPQRVEENSRVASPVTEEERFGIRVEQVVVSKSENEELGFQVYGGRGGGPSGEDLPVFVVAVERNSVVWPSDQVEPLLTNGDQLLSLNGQSLPGRPLYEIEAAIRASSDHLTFTVVRLNK